MAKKLWNNKLIETTESAENNLNNGKSQKEKVNINCKKDMLFI